MYIHFASLFLPPAKNYAHGTVIGFGYGRLRAAGYDVAHAEEHENLLTYIPPASARRAGFGDDACATV